MKPDAFHHHSVLLNAVCSWMKPLFKQLFLLMQSDHGRRSILQKIICWLLLFVLVLLLGFWLLLQPKFDTLSQAQGQQHVLLDDYRAKQQHILQLQHEQQRLQQIQKNYRQQLAQLTKPNELAMMLEALHQLAAESGVKVKNIQLEQVHPQKFLTEQPILIEAQGDYHALGRFVSQIALVPQLLTMHDFMIQSTGQKQKKSNIALLDFRLVLKTYGENRQAIQ